MFKQNFRNSGNYATIAVKKLPNVSQVCSCYTTAELLAIASKNESLPSLKHYSFAKSPVDLTKPIDNPKNLNDLQRLQDKANEFERQYQEQIKKQEEEQQEKEHQELVDSIREQIKNEIIASNVSQSPTAQE